MTAVSGSATKPSVTWPSSAATSSSVRRGRRGTSAISAAVVSGEWEAKRTIGGGSNEAPLPDAAAEMAEAVGRPFTKVAKAEVGFAIGSRPSAAANSTSASIRATSAAVSSRGTPSARRSAVSTAAESWVGEAERRAAGSMRRIVAGWCWNVWTERRQRSDRSSEVAMTCSGRALNGPLRPLLPLLLLLLLILLLVVVRRSEADDEAAKAAKAWMCSASDEKRSTSLGWCDASSAVRDSRRGERRAMRSVAVEDDDDAEEDGLKGTPATA